MNDGLIPRRYAKALYKYALEKGSDATLYSQMRRLSAAFTSEPDLGKVMANPFVADDDKRRLIVAAAVAKGEDDAMLNGFITLLQNNKRLSMMQQIALAYEDIYRAMRGIKRVTITSATKLDAATLDRLKAMITKQLAPGESIQLDTRIDPDLIGGFTVSIDNEKLDASVATQLKQMRLKLLNN